MEHLHGHDLGVDLNRLRGLGRYDLTDLSYAFAGFDKRVGDAKDSIKGDAPFDLPCDAWTALKDKFQNILADTADSLAEASAAIEWIVNIYSATDTEAATALKKAWHGRDAPQIPPASRAGRKS